MVEKGWRFWRAGRPLWPGCGGSVARRLARGAGAGRTRQGVSPPGAVSTLLPARTPGGRGRECVWCLTWQCGFGWFRAASRGRRTRICTFTHLPQEKSAPCRTFFHRTDNLAVRLGKNVQDLKGILGISRRTLFECRSADSAVSGKTWAKLEAAERAAGILPAAPDPVRTAESEGKLKDSDPPPHHFLDAGKLIEDLRGDLAEKNRQIERLLGIIEAMARRDERPPDPPPPATGKRSEQVIHPERSLRAAAG